MSQSHLAMICFWIQRKANPHRCVVVHNGVVWFICSSLSTDGVCNMWYGKQLWHRAECVFASELQFHGLLAPFSIQTLQEQKKKSSYLKDCSSHDMYNWPLTSTDELLALPDVSYIGMEAFQMIVFAVVTSVEYCCTTLVKKSNKTLHFFTKLSCAFRIYTARWL